MRVAKEISTRLKEIGDMTITELARKADMDRSDLSRILNGHTGMTVSTYERLRKALGYKRTEWK